MNKLVAMLYSFMQRLSKAILAKCKEWRVMLKCIADFYGAGIVVALVYVIFVGLIAVVIWNFGK